MNFSIYLLSFVISILGSSSRAANASDIRFDQGIDASTVLETIQTSSKDEPEVGIEGVPVFLPHSTLTLKNALSPKDGTPQILSGGFLNAIIQHPGYFRASKTLPIVREQPPEISKPLLADWDEIQLTRAVLLDDAGSLEIRRDKIVEDGEKLDKRAAELMKKQETLNSEIDDYNNQCAGRPRTPFCDSWRAKLVRAKAGLKEEFDEHNGKVDEWRAALAVFNDDAGKHNSKRTTWGETIGVFLQSVEDKANYEESCHFVKLIEKKCVYKCQGFVHGVPVVELGFWWTKAHGGQCDQFVDLDDDLEPLNPPRPPEGISGNAGRKTK